MIYFFSPTDSDTSIKKKSIPLYLELFVIILCKIAWDQGLLCHWRTCNWEKLYLLWICHLWRYPIQLMNQIQYRSRVWDQCQYLPLSKTFDPKMKSFLSDKWSYQILAHELNPQRWLYHKLNIKPFFSFSCSPLFLLLTLGCWDRGGGVGGYTGVIAKLFDPFFSFFWDITIVRNHNKQIKIKKHKKHLAYLCWTTQSLPRYSNYPWLFT